MKNHSARLGSLFLVIATLIAVSACSPQFFTSTNTDAPAMTMTTAASPGGRGTFQGVIAPGSLCIGSLEPDGTLTFLIDLGATTTNRLMIWDDDNDEYKSIASNQAWAESRLEELVLIDGITAANYTGLSFSISGADTYKPTVNLGLSTLMTDNDQAGKIWTFRVIHTDPVDGVDLFKTGTSNYMTQDRVIAVRQGVDNDTTAPTIESFTVADGGEVPSDQVFTLTVSEELGNLQAAIIDPKTATYGDEDYFPLVVSDLQLDGNGDYVYTFYSSRGLETGTSYIFAIASRLSTTAPDRPWWKEGMPISQDLTGNLLANNTSYFEAEQDLVVKLGGSNSWTWAYALDFTTQSE